MKTNFDPKMQAMLQSLYRNGAANADFLPIPEGLESFSADSIVESRNTGRYADPHPIEPGLVKDALKALKERAESGLELRDPLERLSAELLRVMSLTIDWDADIPAAREIDTRPPLVESRFEGTVEETFAYEGDFKAFAAGLRVRLSAKYPASVEKLEVLDKKLLYPGTALTQVKVSFRVTFKLARELDYPGPPVPVLATIFHANAPMPTVRREVLNVEYIGPHGESRSAWPV